jgi:hypothetical protein
MTTVETTANTAEKPRPSPVTGGVKTHGVKGVSLPTAAGKQCKYRARDRSPVSDRWLYAWGLASIGLGGASLIVPLYAVELGGGPITLGILAAAAAGTFSAPSA